MIGLAGLRSRKVVPQRSPAELDAMAAAGAVVAAALAAAREAAVPGATSYRALVSFAAAELARRALASDFRAIDPRLARIVLVQAGPRLLPAGAPSAPAHAAAL